MEKVIVYFGQKTKIGCDEKCNKAWGLNVRPRIQLSDNPDDYCYLSDTELNDASIDPGIYEGYDGKPTCRDEMLNNWCVRQCERCVKTKVGKSDDPLEYPNFNKRLYSLGWESEKKELIKERNLLMKIAEDRELGKDEIERAKEINSLLITDGERDDIDEVDICGGRSVEKQKFLEEKLGLKISNKNG